MSAAGLWLGASPLVLASGSATRRLLLESAGLLVLAHPADIDERAVERLLAGAGGTPPAIALALARAKALHVGRHHPGALVLGGDQTLSLDGRHFHKPRSQAEARAQLKALAGATHQLDAAVALVRDGELVFETVCRASLTMRRLSDAFIDRYLDMAGPSVCDSVGGYQVEGIGIHLFDTIEGDQSTILGLPLLPLLGALRRLGFLAG